MTSKAAINEAVTSATPQTARRVLTAHAKEITKGQLNHLTSLMLQTGQSRAVSNEQRDSAQHFSNMLTRFAATHPVARQLLSQDPRLDPNYNLRYANAGCPLTWLPPRPYFNGQDAGHRYAICSGGTSITTISIAAGEYRLLVIDPNDLAGCLRIVGENDCGTTQALSRPSKLSTARGQRTPPSCRGWATIL
jgi:hypothetical protein